MMRRTAILVALLAAALLSALLVATRPPARDDRYTSAEGHVYVLAATAEGVTLTSQGTVGRLVGSASLGGPDILALRPDCTAEADGETGRWGQGLFALRVDLPGREVTFWLQRLAMAEAGCSPP